MEKELRIKLNTVSDLKGIESVKRSFSELERESLRAVSSQRNISVATSDTAKSVDNLSERIGFMGHAYVGFQAVMAGSSYMSDLTKDAIRQADTWNLLEGRLKLVTSSTQQLASVQAGLFDVAQESRTSYESNADLYARIARATQDMNKSQYETLDVTEAISKSFIVSGAAAESAKAAVIQLGQGFASGTLRGEELNSVLEQAPRLSEAIADGMHVSVGQLKTLGEQGKLTAEKVYEAIRTQKSAIEEEFDQMPKTVGQSLVVLTNQIGLTIHEFDQMHGVTAGIASAISDVTVVLSEHSSEIGDYVGYAGTAVTAIVAWKIGTVALGSAQKIHAAYIAASTVATTSYSIATNTATTSVTTLTARQVASNIALSGWNKLVALNPYAIAGAAIIGVGLLLKDQADQLRDSVRRTAVDVENLSAKALQAKITYSTMQLDAVNRSIEDPSFMKSVFGNERIDLHRKAQLENELKAYGKQLQKLHEEASKPSSNNSGGNKQNPLSEEELKKIEALKEKQKRSAEQIAKLNHDLNDEIFKATASEYEKAMKLIDDGVAKYREGGANKIRIAKRVSLKQEEYLEAEYAKAVGQFDALDKETAEKTKSRLAISEDMYTKLNELSGNWYDNELLNTSKWVNDYIEKGGDIEKANEYLNDSILKLDQKRYDEQAELAKKQWEDQNSGWISFFSDFEKAMDNQLFDAMTGKWNDFGDWLKDFWSSITTSIARAASSQLANALIGGVQNFVIGSPGRASGLMGIIAGTMGVGSTLSADDIASLGGISGQAFTTDGGTVIDAAGKITSGGSDMSSIMDGLSIASSIKTAYDVVSGGLSASIMSNGMAATEWLANAGWLSDTGLIGANNFITGFANPGTMMQSGWGMAGGALSSGLMGGAGGYLLGTLGDKLLGANTYAGVGGAAAGALGGIAGSLGLIGSVGGPLGALIGAGLGALIGGAFGKTSVQDTGMYFGQATGEDQGFDTIQSYVDKKKKSWFSSSSWTEYGAVSATDIKKIEGIFDTYDYLLAQLGSVERIVLAAGKYSRNTFQDQLSKNFITAFTGIPEKIEEAFIQYSMSTTLKGGWVQTKVIDETFGAMIDSIGGQVESVFLTRTVNNPIFDEIYSQWVEYAESIDKTVMEALSDSINTFIQSQREFEVWSLERSGNSIESLQKQAEWLQQDFQNLANMIGATGVTVDNFTTLYEQAIKESFDPTTISQWQSLGTALRSATEAQDAYAAALAQTSAQQQQGALDAFNTLGATYSALSNTITNVQGMIDDINGVTMTLDKAGYDPEKIMQAYQAQTAAITAQHTTRLNALNVEMESIKKIADYSKSLINAARSLRYSALSDSGKFEYSTSTLNALIASATGKLSSGADIADEVSRITDLSGDYAQLAQGYYATQAEFDYAVGTMANKIEALGGGAGSNATLSDIEAAIIAENGSTSDALDALKSESIAKLQSIIDASGTAQQGILNQLETMMNTYVDFWGEGSPIIGSLRDILNAIMSQDGSTGIYGKSAIDSAYSSVLGRTADASGAQYWSSQLASGAVASSQIGIAVGAAAASNGEIGVADYVTKLYESGLGRAPDAGGLAFWTDSVANGSLSIADLSSTFASAAEQNGEKFKAFADGGMVKGGRGGVLGLVGEKDYDELVTPLKDSNDPLGGKAIIAELKALREEVAKLREENTKYSSQTADNTKPSRYL